MEPCTQCGEVVCHCQVDMSRSRWGRYGGEGWGRGWGLDVVTGSLQDRVALLRATIVGLQQPHRWDPASWVGSAFGQARHAGYRTPTRYAYGVLSAGSRGQPVFQFSATMVAEGMEALFHFFGSLRDVGAPPPYRPWTEVDHPDLIGQIFAPDPWQRSISDRLAAARRVLQAMEREGVE